MIEYLKLLVEVIGYIVWPLIVITIILIFKEDVKSLLTRLKSAEIKDIKIELQDQLEDVKLEAINHGVTMLYSSQVLENEFNLDSQLPKTHIIIETWKEIESLIKGLDNREDFRNTHNSIKYLQNNNIIPDYLANLILDLRKLRNLAVHQSELSISEEDYLSWISISKSVLDRLQSITIQNTSNN